MRGGEYCLPFAPDRFPYDIRRDFSGFSRFALEIGCGWGEFTRAYAAERPETLVVAVEKKLARVMSSSRSQRQEKIPNIRYLILDIAWFFGGIFAAQQFDAIMINFPDPWPKARHHKHRFISPEFAATLGQIAKPDARLLFATDNYLYAREAAQVFEAAAEWRNTQGKFFARCDIPGRPVSYFEKLHRDEGALIYFLEYART